ncbi:hypothetical protein CN488_29945, partial [Bacillus anthracis]
MKAYKKFKKALPFAVLSTAILFSPAATTFAAADTQADHPVIQNKVIGGNGSGGNEGGGVGPPPIDGDNGDGGTYTPGNNGGSSTGSPFDEAQLKKDVLERAKAAIFNNPEAFSMPGYMIDELRNKNVSSQTYTPTYSYINEGDIDTDVKVDRYTDAGQVELLSYRNETPVGSVAKFS